MAHIHEKIDWCVSAYIVHNNKVLLRWHEKYHKLLAVGGHIELDEDPLQAVKRECLEEVGLPIAVYGEEGLIYYPGEQLQQLPRPAGMNIHRINETHQHIDVAYYATTPHTNVVPENPTDKWEWLTAEEIKERTDILPDIKDYALGALATYAQA